MVVETNNSRSTITKETIEGLMETVRNLYLADDIPWVIGYSGGKDSTATLQLVWLAIKKLPADFEITAQSASPSITLAIASSTRGA